MSSKNKKLAGEFRQFIAKGNVVDLAVAVVIGAAFNKIVSQIVSSFINPLLGLILQGLSLSEWKWVLKDEIVDASGEVIQGEVAITYGLILQAVIDFLLTALVVFIIIKVYNHLRKRVEEESRRLYEELNRDEVEAKKKAEEEAKAEAQRLEAEAKAKAEAEAAETKAREEAKIEYFKTQQSLLTEIRDSLKK
ncbi:MAG: large conductance mechanosensitive channel protein MscL [Clostridia bacterium]|nr:large conductance mechanosensitive channel protein MscL [Clostridia bacterium]